jgi:hypothetical protein
MRAIALPGCDFTWLPDSSAGSNRPSTDDHKILCQGGKLFRTAGAVKDFLMEKSSTENKLFFNQLRKAFQAVSAGAASAGRSGLLFRAVQHLVSGKMAQNTHSLSTDARAGREITVRARRNL